MEQVRLVSLLLVLLEVLNLDFVFCRFCFTRGYVEVSISLPGNNVRNLLAFPLQSVN